VDQQDLSGLLLPHIRQMEPYTPILPFEVLSRQLGRTPEQIVKLDANENPHGPAPAVRAALAEYPFLHIYPDPEQHELREALAGYIDVPAANILVGQGADELIDLISRVFLGPGDTVIDCPPTFGMYSFDAGLAGARVLAVPRQRDFSVDVEAIEAAVRDGRRGHGAVSAERSNLNPTSVTPKLLFLTSPNNPDGSLLPPRDLARLLELPLMVVLDEAYIEFAGLECSVVNWVARYDNLIVLRTFSKWAGIAGLRLGYGVFPDWLMPYLWRAKQPYNVNVAATVAGLASLAHRDEIQPMVDALIEERGRLQDALAQFSFLRPYPSRANFVLCRVVARDALVLKNRLAAQGVLVRHFARPRLENCIRVSAGRPQDTIALLDALGKVGG
jgi:histidinol-phosphate aminotransferase